MKLLVATSNRGKFAELDDVLGMAAVQLVSLAEFPALELVPENGVTFLENARVKAAHYHRLTRMPVVADDSGLEVELLGGAPGVHSARYAGPGASDRERVKKLLQEIDAAKRGPFSAKVTGAALLSGQGGETEAHPRTAASSGLNEVRPLTAEEKFKQMESFEIGRVAVPKIPGFDLLSPARFVCALSYHDKGEEQFFCESECRGFIVSSPQGKGGFGYDPVFLLPESEKTMAELTRAEKNELSHRGRAARRLRQFLEERR